MGRKHNLRAKKVWKDSIDMWHARVSAGLRLGVGRFCASASPIADLFVHAFVAQPALVTQARGTNCI